MLQPWDTHKAQNILSIHDQWRHVFVDFIFVTPFFYAQKHIFMNKQNQKLSQS